MDLAPNTWCRTADLLRGPTVELRDRSLLLHGSEYFLGSAFHALTGTIRQRVPTRDPDLRDRYINYLQFTLEAVDDALVDGLPPTAGMSPQLLSQQLLCLEESTYAYDLHVRGDELHCFAPGAVCLRLVLGDNEEPLEMWQRRSRDVADAWRSGLIDDFTRSRADFRLDIKPLTRRLMALVDSEYLPEDAYQIDVVFAQWYAVPGNRPVMSPLPDGPPARAALAECELGFQPTIRPRGMRVSDLFRRRNDGSN